MRTLLGFIEIAVVLEMEMESRYLEAELSIPKILMRLEYGEIAST